MRNSLCTASGISEGLERSLKMWQATLSYFFQLLRYTQNIIARKYVIKVSTSPPPTNCLRISLVVNPFTVLFINRFYHLY